MPDVAALLDQAEDIVNSAAPDILAEFEKKSNATGRVPAQQEQEQSKNKKKKR